MMESKVVVVHAEYKPMEGILNPGPHQIYRNPVVSLETRKLGELNHDEVRVRMIYAGVCGTDLHLVEKSSVTGYILSSAPAMIPPEGRIIGHEGVGEVLKTGANVRHVKPGDFVTFESIIVCHFCDVCRKGRFNQCRFAKLMGLEKDGLFGTIVDVPAMLAHDVTALAKSDSDLRAAACVEPAGVAYVACRNAHMTVGDVVVIFGAGPIGLFTAILSKAIFGASTVHIVDPVKFRREFASRWSDEVYDVDEFFENSPCFVDVVVEASGNFDNITRIFNKVNANGRIVLLARSGANLVLDDLDHMITNAVSLTGSRGHLCGAFTDILNLYKKKRIHLNEIVTDVVNGPGQLCNILKSTDKILNENCKVLVRF